MPKIYSSQEKENIRISLRRAAEKCLARYGVKRTTVDELVRMVGIPKGTFYLFYESKEHLFLDVVKAFTESENKRYLDMLQELDENHIVTSLTTIFHKMVMSAYERGIYRFLDDNQMELVMRKISPQERTEMEKAKKGYIENLLSYFAIDDEEDVEAFQQAFSSIYYILLHDDMIEDLDKAMHTLIRGLVLELVE